MFQIPSEFQSTISVFSACFSRPTFKKAKQLLLGAIICPASRTVCNVLRTLGLEQQNTFYKYHRVLSRARYSLLAVSTRLVSELIAQFCPTDEPLVFGIDETIERRRGPKIKKKGVYRDPVRSSKSHLVKTTGLRWMSMMLLSTLPWLDRGRYWALPFLTALCPSKRFYQTHSPRREKKLTDWARQFILWLGRYVRPLNPRVYLVGDGSYATYELMTTADRVGIGLVGRLKFNSRLFHLPGPKPKGKRGPAPHMGKRILNMNKRLTDRRISWQSVTFTDWYGQGDKTMLITQGISIWDSNKGYWVKVKWVLVVDPDGQLNPVLLATNDVGLSAIDIVRFAVRRWRVEVTFAEVRRHLGVQTQRQWSELAIERVTPILLGIKSIVCLLALPLYQRGKLVANNTRWHKKQAVSFSDALACVRRRLWPSLQLPTTAKTSEVGSLRARIQRLYYTLSLAVA